MTPHALPATSHPTALTELTHSHLLANAQQASGNGLGPLIGLGLLWFVLYLAHCWRWPFRACRHCAGSPGKALSRSGKAWRICPACKGTPARMRFGRRILNHLANARKDHDS